jgi:hypothetical protein
VWPSIAMAANSARASTALAWNNINTIMVDVKKCRKYLWCITINARSLEVLILLVLPLSQTPTITAERFKCRCKNPAYTDIFDVLCY